MYQGLERKKISDIVNYLVCFVLYEKNIIEKRTREHSQTENQTYWLIHL